MKSNPYNKTRTIYTVATAGYYRCPEFSTLPEARKYLASLVSDSVKACRARYGCAYKQKNGTDNYTIRIGNDAQAYNVWSTHYISAV